MFCGWEGKLWAWHKVTATYCQVYDHITCRLAAVWRAESALALH